MKIHRFAGEHYFLSNFYACEIEFDGRVYPSVEHAYQAAKTTSDFARRKIAATVRPAQAKRYGKTVDLRADWEQAKVDVMRDLLKKKFSKPVLAMQLRETGNVELEEGNWWGDTFWGVCKGQGKNMLGQLLMEIRDTL